MTLDLLLSDIRACDLCAQHLPLGPRPVIQAHQKARILVAGQAPGRKVHETGLAFNDPSGDRLRDWMRLSRQEFYNPHLLALVPMGFCYPGTGKSGDLPPRPECAQHWRHALLKQLPNIQLTLAIGQYAQAFHLGSARQSTLTKTVRAWRDFWPEILPLPHPSPRNNLWLRNNPWFETELLPFVKQAIKEALA